MRTFFNDFLVQLKGIWSRLDGGQRLVVVAVLAATVVGLGGIVWFAGRPSYEVVFTATSQEDLATMQQALGNAGISYQMGDDGWTFLVERGKVGLATAAKNKAGIAGRNDPQVGGSSMLMDDSETKAFKLAQAASAQAESMILGLDGVAQVRVAASKPRTRSAFRDRDRENRPSATVTLKLKSGASFPDRAKAAANIASSQLMIPLENVLVTSSTGAQNYRYDPDREVGGGSSDFLATQRRMGDERAQLAQERLDAMWPGRTSVAVTVELDPNWEVTSQKVVPQEPIVRTEKSTKDSTEKNAPRPGDSGVTTNDPKSSDSQKNETKDRTYVTEIGERRTGKLAPDIKRICVAVLYDKKLDKLEGFSSEELKKTVKSIVGWDKKRDTEDDFSMLPGDFQPPDVAVDLTSGPGLADLALRWGPTIGQILGVIVVVLFLRGLFKRSRAASSSAEVMPAAVAKEANVTPEELQKQMRREIEKSIASDPAALAKLLESWLTEQKA